MSIGQFLYAVLIGLERCEGLGYVQDRGPTYHWRSNYSVSLHKTRKILGVRFSELDR